MLEGLEMTEVKLSKLLSEKENRLEPEYWNRKNSIKIETFSGDEVIDFVQYGTSEELNEFNSGYPVLRLNEFNLFFVGVPQKYCDIITYPEYENYRLLKDDVLICRTNGNPKLVGRSAIVQKDTNYAYASYLFKVRPKKDLMQPATLVAFLRGRYGRNEIDAYSMVGNQTNFSPAKFREISIPKLSFDLNNLISKIFAISYRALESSETLYTKAENILLQELGLSNWQPTIKNSNTKTLKESFLDSGRIDAEYYQPKYDQLLAHLSGYEIKILGDIVSIKKSIEPGSDAYQTEGIPFIRVADLSKNGISESAVYLDAGSFDVVGLTPPKNTILLSKDGSVGIAYKVEEDIKRITSGAILHLTVTDKEFLPDYLTLMLNSIVVKLQAERDAGGSIIQHWKPEEIKKVIIPKLSMDIQSKIAEKIQESFRLQKQSKDLLEAAKTAVEMAIEQDEQTALNYLQNIKDA